MEVIVHNNSRNAVALQRDDKLQYTLQSFLDSGLTRKEFNWFRHAVPAIGEEAALLALFDGHTDWLLTDYLLGEKKHYA